MGRIGFPELLLILLACLLLWGPTKLPELGRSLGRGIAEFRRGWREDPLADKPPADASRGATAPKA